MDGTPEWFTGEAENEDSEGDEILSGLMATLKQNGGFASTREFQVRDELNPVAWRVSNNEAIPFRPSQTVPLHESHKMPKIRNTVKKTTGGTCVVKGVKKFRRTVMAVSALSPSRKNKKTKPPVPSFTSPPPRHPNRKPKTGGSARSTASTHNRTLSTGRKRSPNAGFLTTPVRSIHEIKSPKWSLSPNSKSKQKQNKKSTGKRKPKKVAVPSQNEFHFSNAGRSGNKRSSKSLRCEVTSPDSSHPCPKPSKSTTKSKNYHHARHTSISIDLSSPFMDQSSEDDGSINLAPIRGEAMIEINRKMCDVHDIVSDQNSSLPASPRPKPKKRISKDGKCLTFSEKAKKAYNSKPPVKQIGAVLFKSESLDSNTSFLDSEMLCDDEFLRDPSPRKNTEKIRRPKNENERSPAIHDRKKYEGNMSPRNKDNKTINKQKKDREKHKIKPLVDRQELIDDKMFLSDKVFISEYDSLLETISLLPEVGNDDGEDEDQSSRIRTGIVDAFLELLNDKEIKSMVARRTRTIIEEKI